MLNDLFDEGLKFTRLAWQQEWTESAARLQRIVDKGHEAVVTQLGSDQLLSALRGLRRGPRDHRRPARACPADPQGPGGLPDGRTYVLRVAAMADDQDAAGDALVTKLLAPLKS